jgi:AraC-like DNA-binding protein
MATGDLYFLLSGYYPDCTYRVDKKFEGYHSLQYMSHGGVELSYDDNVHVLEGAWFWPAYPGPRIRFHAAPGCVAWSHRFVAFRGPLVSRWTADGLLADSPQRAPAARDFSAAFDELLLHVRGMDRWSTLRAVNVLEGILIDLAHDRAQPERTEPWLARVLERVSAEGNFAPDYAEIADEAGMGLSTLRRRFKEMTGVSLHAYALQCRIAAARGLLGETNLPLKEIAARLGYGDIYFFSQQFRAQAGVSPGAYRRSRQS